MNIKQLEYFMEVADRHSFRETADAFYISRSSLSRQISELENELGVRLFRRSTRCVDLTEEGYICLKSARRIVKETEALKNRLAEDPEAVIPADDCTESEDLQDTV